MSVIYKFHTRISLLQFILCNLGSCSWAAHLANLLLNLVIFRMTSTMRKSAAKLAIFNNTNDTLINGDKLRQEAWNSFISTQRPMFPYHLRLLWSMLMAMMVLPRNLDNVHLYFNLAEISRVPVLTIARFILLNIHFF